MWLAARRETLLLPLVAAFALVFGAALAREPMLATGALVGAGILFLAFMAPVTHLSLLLIATAIVPYGLMNSYGVGGSSGAGLLLSDILLLTGLARAATVLLRERLGRAELLAVVAMIGLLGLFSLQFVHGVSRGSVVSTAGNELRTLLGFGTLLVALPILHDPESRERLLHGLLVVGMLLGLVGLFQWFGGAAFSANGDFGVREGISYTSNGRGQLQGGLFAYPVAIVLAFAALVAPERRSALARTMIIAVLALNAICCLLTFERTMWVVSIVGCAFVALRAERIPRATIVLRGLSLALIGLTVLSIAAPGTFTAARERLLSIGQYGNDVSVEYRLRESQFVIRAIESAPVTGSGLGATVRWGRPQYGVPATNESYTHNGYLWLTWKIGLLGSALVFGLMFAALVRRGLAAGSATFATLVVGAQGALAALLLANVTFPSVSAGSSTPTVGLLLALSFLPRVIGSR